MARKDKNVTDGELAVLDVLWRRGRSTVREITGEVYAEQTFSKYQTVQKLLERLENKRCVKRYRSTNAHTFEATVERSELIGHCLEQVAEKLCDGSLTPLLMHLASSTRLKPKERDSLRKIIDGQER